MPGPTSIPSTEDLDGNQTSEPPVDLGDDDINDFDCGSSVLISLNNYVKNADTEAAAVLSIMSGSLDTIESKKVVSEGELANAESIFTAFQSSVETINNDALTTLNSILADQNAASSDTISVATSIKNLFNGVSLSGTSPTELTLLIEEARALLPTAEAHLASTLSYKNDLYAEVANIESSVDAEAVTSKAAIDSCVTLAQNAKSSAEVAKENIDYRFIEIKILYGHTHENYWYGGVDSDGCLTTPQYQQDLSTEYEQAEIYAVDAENLIG